ncbi:S8 family peptidase [Priestia megaterium]|uniref:S8 family peptidase n=1 Tax=Priestia megaterium TaxID=1404 RepID=UPI003D02FEF3
METNTYLLKPNENAQLEVIIGEIVALGGRIAYESPIMPLIAFESNEKVKSILEKQYELNYIIDSPEDGNLMESGDEVMGSLSSTFTPLQIVPKVDFASVRSAGCTGWGVTVAVLDSGISESFVKDHYDFTGTGSMPKVHHGNAVGNIIKRFARGSNIISCKVTQELTGMKLIDVLKGIDHAVNCGANVINMSLGFEIPSCKKGEGCPICDVVNTYSQLTDVLFVVSAGNGGSEGSITCPGNAQEAITVGSIDERSKAVARHSSKGQPGSNKPNILTSGTIYYNNDYDLGTSFSAPIVTGVSVAVKSKKAYSSAEIKDLIYSTAEDIHVPTHHQGFGLMDLNRILEVVTDDKIDNQAERQNES